MVEEGFLALFQGNGIDDALALHTHQSRFDDVPFRGVDHHRHAGDIRLGGNEIQEGRHLLARIEQAVVHVDINDLRPVFHLFPGNGEGFFVILLFNEAEELTRPCDIAPLAYVDKVVFRLDFQHFEAGEHQRFFP